jgi:hypothetical protein
VPALDTPATLRAAADVNVELPADGLSRDLGLELPGDSRVGDGRAAVGASAGQVGFEDFADPVLGRRCSVPVLSVLVAGFAPGSFGVGFGGLFSEGCGGSFGGAAGLVQLGLEALDLGAQASIWRCWCWTSASSSS